MAEGDGLQSGPVKSKPLPNYSENASIKQDFNVKFGCKRNIRTLSVAGYLRYYDYALYTRDDSDIILYADVRCLKIRIFRFPHFNSLFVDTE